MKRKMWLKVTRHVTVVKLPSTSREASVVMRNDGNKTEDVAASFKLIEIPSVIYARAASAHKCHK